MSRDPRGLGRFGMEPSVPQAPESTAQGRAKVHWGSTTSSKTSSRTQQQQSNQSDTGSPQGPGETHTGKRLSAGWAELARLRLLALTTTRSLTAPLASWEGGGEPPDLHGRAARPGVIPSFLHPSTGGNQAPPNDPSCLVRLVLLETGSGAMTHLPSMDAGGDSPSGCW